MSISIALTVGEIALRLKAPIHRVEYVIRSRAIQPTSRAGNARIFTDADMERIGSELRRIANQKKGRNG
jgi:DNA-binding transcriptional MerR regulator